ncbi:MAG: flagellar basal body-associated FliL family protein [Bacteriovoracaceae bacterium]|nr:flagellar basal body-associated FliL family protein [Bacteriovoracaceae bacterium]
MFAEKKYQDGELMAEEDTAQGTDKFQSGSGPSKNPLVAVMLIVNFVFMIGLAYMQYVGHQKLANSPSIQDVVKSEMKAVMGEDGESVTGEAIKDDGILFPLEGFVANLAQGDGPRRYLRMNVVLKFNKDSNEEEFKARKPQIRDSIIGIVNSKRPSDLLKLEGKNFLKEEIKAAINTFLVDAQVIDVYYIDFQIN